MPVALYFAYLVSGNSSLPISVENSALSHLSAGFQVKVLKIVGSLTDLGSLDVTEKCRV